MATPSPRPRAVLFDLDGTLADTALDLGAALNRLLAEHDRAPVDHALIRPIASHGARGLIRLGFGIDREHPEFDGLRQRFLDLYELSFADATRLFDGVNEMLQGLDRMGIRWGIVTNKPMRFTDPLVPTLGFISEPGAIVSGDTVGVPKPDPKPMFHAASLLGIPPEQCWYVGDAERDIEAGRNAGMQTVLADWGYIAPEEHPDQWGADVRIPQPLALLDLLGASVV
ncbi:HAD-IA family hydrolase [Burkholderiaceae bacterium DAT-1]|nr:HAD-IA family hydrolase [Burkholderiaceae bacterium DAT-1]